MAKAAAKTGKPKSKKPAEEPYIPPQKLEPEMVLGQREKILIYGDPGTGKTHLALTAIGLGPVYFLAIGGDNEVKTRYSRPFLETYPLDHEHPIFIDAVAEDRKDGWEVTDNPTGLDRVKERIDGFVNWEQRENVGVKTVIVDNATTLEELQMNKAIAAEYDLANNKMKTTLKTEREWGIRKPHDSTWGGAQSLMDKFANAIFELPYHVVFVAHERKEWEQKERSRDRILVSVLPEFVGQQRINIPRAFDSVWRMTAAGGGRNIQYNTQTVKDNIVLAKTRVGGILRESERNLDLTEAIRKFSEYPKTLTR